MLYNYKNNNVIRVPLIQHVIAFDVTNGIVLLHFWQFKRNERKERFLFKSFSHHH